MEAPPSVSAAAATLSTRTVVRGDVHLAVTVRSPRAPRATLLLVHGYPDDQDVWAPVAERLAATFRVVTYDVRGAGASSRPKETERYTLAELAADLLAVKLAVAGDEAVHLVGHDWGSIQAWEPVTEPAWAPHFASFTSISGPCLDHVGLPLRALGDPAARLRQALRSWYIAAFHLPAAAPLAWRFASDRFDAIVARTEGPAAVRPSATRAEDGAAGVALYRANMLPRLLRPRRRGTTIPVQLLAPVDDAYVTPALTEGFGAAQPDARLRRLVPDVERHVLPGGHWVIVSDPERVAAAITSFVTRVLRREAPARAGTSIPPRAARFAVEEAPLHWVAPATNDAEAAADAVQTTHTLNVLSLLLPEGERWFQRTALEALEALDDPGLRREIRGFAGQEANHARAHEDVIAHLSEQGLPVQPLLDELRRVFALGAPAPLGAALPPRLARAWLRHRVGIIAAIEHYTTLLGGWVLAAEPLAGRARSTALMDLLRWHGAEELEHRAVAFDVFEALGGGYGERVLTLAEAAAGTLFLWGRGVRALTAGDPEAPAVATVAAYLREAERGALPSPRALAAATWSYLTPRFHPAHEPLHPAVR